jgi:rhodanese-related sulfurtransferase
MFSNLLAAAELIGVDVEQLKTMQQQQQPLIIDIRTSKEVAELGIIPGSKNIEFYDTDGNYDAKAWLNKLDQLKQTPKQAVVLVCHGGFRSEKVGKFLINKIGMEDIYHLEGGVSSWKKQGNETVQSE